MLTKRLNHRTNWLVGDWHAAAGQIHVCFTIEMKGNGFRIMAIDESDGERLAVSKVKWDGQILRFETRNPSNKWRTKNSLKVISKTKAIHELTYWEMFEKILAK